MLSTAISLAQQITANSPDAVQSSKVALLLSQKHNFSETFTTHNLSPESRRVYKGANIKVSSFTWLMIYNFYSRCYKFQEGLKAFTEVSLYFFFYFLFDERVFCLSFLLFLLDSDIDGFLGSLMFRNVHQNGRILQSCNNNSLTARRTSPTNLKLLYRSKAHDV